jgi:hypothetical protein
MSKLNGRDEHIRTRILNAKNPPFRQVLEVLLGGVDFTSHSILAESQSGSRHTFQEVQQGL